MRRSHPHPDGVGLGHRLRRGAAPSQMVQKGEAWLNSLTSGADSIGALALRHGSSIYAPSDCKRLDGPPLPPHGTPTPTRSLESIDDRIKQLQVGRRDLGGNTPPLDTYRTKTEEHGVVYQATDAYITWFHSRYPRAGGRNQCERSLPSSPSKGVGGDPVAF